MDKTYYAYLNHYKIQDGGGIPVFHGVRYQRGMGWFSRLIGGIGNFIKGIAPSIAKKALPSAVGLAQDIIDGQNVGSSAVTRLKQAGKDVTEETLEQIKKKLQEGQGIPRNYLKNPIYNFQKRKCPKNNKKINKNKKRKK